MTKEAKREYNNSAGRLLKIFRQAKAGAPGSAAQNTTAIGVWHSILDIKPHNLGAVQRALLSLNETIDEAEQEIRETQGANAELFLRNFDQFRRVAQPTNLDLQWAQYQQSLTDEALRSLEFCANALPEESPVKPDELQQIREAVESLFKQVRDSKLKKPLRDWLLEMLSTVKRSLDQYEIRGAKAFRKPLVTMTGELGAYGQKLTDVKEQEPDVFDKLGNIFGRLSTLAEKAEKLRPLLEYAAGPATELVKLLTAG